MIPIFIINDNMKTLVRSIPIFYDSSFVDVENVYSKFLGYKISIDNLISKPQNLQEIKLALRWHTFQWKCAKRRIKARSIL